MDPQPTDRHPPPSRPSTATVWLIAALLFLAVLPYVNTLGNGFVYDDNNEVLTNPYIRSFSHVGDIFSTRILAHLGARGATNYYRPISILGFLICYQLFGVIPYGYHLANLLLHAVTVCLLFGLTRRLFRDQWLAFAAAAIFALHPIHTESVAWVSGVTDLDLAVFYLAAFWFFLESARPHGARSEWMQAGMVGSFILALLSKEQAVTLPAAAMIFEHFYRHDRAATTWRQKAARYGALWLVAIAYVLFRVRFFGAFAPVQLGRHVSWYEAILSAPPLAALYVWKTLWPVRLVAYYPFHKSVSLLDVRVGAGLGVLALGVLALGVLWKRARRASFSLIWFFLNIAPVLNARWIGPNVFTERYLYLPSVGFCWVAAWGIMAIWRGGVPQPLLAVTEEAPAGVPVPLTPAGPAKSRFPRIALATALAIIAILAFARIVTRNGDWRDDETYYRVTLAQVPEAGGLRLNLGAVYWNHMRPDAAEREWRMALAMSPDSAPLLNNLGLACVGRKQNDEAAQYFQRAMRLRPNYTDAHLNLGRLYEAVGKTVEAEAQLQTAVALAPLSITTRNELGNFYFASGRLPDASAQFQASAASIPNAAAFDSLGEIAGRSGRHDEAEADYRRALGLEPFDPRAHFGLAALLEARGRTAEAAEQYRAGLSVDPNNLEAQAALKRLNADSPHAHAPNP